MGLELAIRLVQICLAVSQLSVQGSSVPWKGAQEKAAASYPTRAGQPPPIFPDHAFSLTRPPSSSGRATHEKPVAAPAPPKRTSPTTRNSPRKAYRQHHALKSSSISLAPTALFPTPHRWTHGSAISPSTSFYKYHHARKNFSHSSPGPSLPVNPHAYNIPGPSISPSQYSWPRWASPAPAPAPSATIPFNSRHTVPPEIAPVGPSLMKKAPPPLFVLALPPPPPNANCVSVTCTDPLTYTPPGSPCGCVWPIQVKLQLGIPIYTFFTLVSELAGDVASSLVLSPSQVRVMGANAASQELDKCTVLIDLVPWEVKFDYASAISIYKKFWKRQVFVKASLFGPYEVVYVRYPGLPPSPPSASSEISTIDTEPYTEHGNYGQSLKPLGVDVRRKKKDGLKRSTIAAIVLSSFTAFLVCLGLIWLLLLKYGTIFKQVGKIQHNITYSPMKPSVAAKSLHGSISSSGSISHSSSVFTCTRPTKNFTVDEIQKATNGLDGSRVIGEGGFGIVYRGTLDDGTEVAVKILKREDQHGDREFLAEVEMLSRLHHRNLVKLMGICNEDEARCLVYELVPNGSLDSHLHGIDKEVAPLDWGVRMKIALGAARGLAYLHEDSNPRVIHRDFKSSNILLENDFTPKVSDFGLARTALDEGAKFISTHVMGTFGYLAPEYAMTGHLLVKSDVYSYGVVVLELLTGRKPVDLSQPPGQENLVTWARPLLTSKEGLELVIDPSIKTNITLDSITKVAAIASMCVQPEVSHRPFMGEVVQALKLVCNEFDEAQAFGSKASAPHSYATTVESKQRVSCELSTIQRRYDPLPEHEHGLRHDTGIALSASDYLIVQLGLEEEEHGPFTRHCHSTSGPLITETRGPFWQRLTGSSRGSRSEHGFSSVKS